MNLKRFRSHSQGFAVKRWVRSGGHGLAFDEGLDKLDDFGLLLAALMRSRGIELNKHGSKDLAG